MSIDVNAIEQTVEVTAVGDEVNVNIIDQPVLVSVTDQIIEVEASGAAGPQGPVGAGVAAGGTTGQVLSKLSNTNYDTVWVNAGAGTVYSVNASGSTGISVTGGPITGAGTLTITNTAPDQIVGLTGAGTAVITGTYPNFTITANDQFSGTVTSVNLTAGTGISVSGGPITSSGNINVVNTSPDQVVSLTGGGTTTITGTYPNFTISSADSTVGTVTSVNMTVPTGLTISGNPITSAGTLALALASGYSIPTTASQATWDAAYNDKINSASVTGTATKTLTLTQQDGGTITANWSDIDTGLTSVGLSMPSAFSVANSPLTSNGTLAVTGAGLASQYIRGDGALADFPTTGGGGSSVSYYLNGSVNQGTLVGNVYYEINKTPILGAGTDFTINADGYIAQFITDANDPDQIKIPAGNWNFELYFSASSNGGSPTFYVELSKYNGTTFTAIASGSATPEGITFGTSISSYHTALAVPETVLLATDRLAIRVYVVHSGRTITMHTEGSHLSEIVTTFSTGLNALNGLTDQVQYFATGTSGTDFAISSATDTHTFNLPIASGTNTGKLSNTDWTSFNAKQNTIILTTTGSSGAATLVGATLNIPQYSDQFVGTVTSVSFTLGGTGTDLNSSVTSSTTTPSITLNVPTASATNRGALSSADWSTFNGKQVALNGTGFVKISGTTISYDNSTYYLASNPNSFIALTALSAGTGISYSNTTGVITNASPDQVVALTASTGISVSGTYPNFTITNTSPSSGGTVTSVGLSSATSGVTIGSTPITTSGTITLAIATATTSQNGLLSSADWTTFNAKQNAITLTTTGTSGAATLVGSTLNIPEYTLSGLGGVPTSRTLTINGTSYDLSANRTWSVGTITTAAATTGGQVSFFNGATVITSVSGLYFDGVDKLGVGNSSPAYNLDVTGTFRSTGNLTAASIIKSGGTSSQYLMADGSTSTLTNPVTGTGTTNYLPKWTSGSAIGNSIISETSSKIDINGTLSVGMTVSPFYNAKFKDYSDGSGVYIGSVQAGGYKYISGESYYNNSTLWYSDLTTSTVIALNDGIIKFYTNSGLTPNTNFTPSERMRITSGGNLLVNSTTDNGNRLQVTGDGTFSSNLGIGTTTPFSATNFTTLTINGTNASLIEMQASGTSYARIQASSSEMSIIARGNTPMVFYTNPGTDTERMRLTPSGNLGLGVQPSAWRSTNPAFQIGQSTSLFSYSSSNVGGLASNAFINSSGNEIYIANGFSSLYQFGNNGEHRWLIAPSGTAGNAITFTQAMTLTANGRLLLGTTTEGTDLLDVNGTGRFTSTLRVTNSGTNTLIWAQGGADASGQGKGNIRSSDQGGTNYWDFGRDNLTTGDFVITQYGGSPNLRLATTTGAATFSSTIQTAAPSGGTAKPFKIGAAASVSPTSPNRTIEIEIDGTTYYLSAKTTNN